MRNTGAKTLTSRDDQPVLVVVAGIIRDEAGRILVSKRHAHQHQGDLWEFPGGKLEQGELLHEALQRELNEELDITVAASRPFMCVEHCYPEKRVRLYFREVTDWYGQPYGKENQPLEWHLPSHLSSLSFPAANQPVVTALQLPDLIYITPPSSEFSHPDLFVDALRQALRRTSSGLLYFKPVSETAADIRAVCDLCNDMGVGLIVNASSLSKWGDGLDMDVLAGLHFSSSTLMELVPDDIGRYRRCYPGAWLSAACHGMTELMHAEALELDFTFLSPVKPTRSHPEAAFLGWDRFSGMAEGRRLPVYALGGLAPKDLPRAREAGARGVAGIRAF